MTTALSRRRRNRPSDEPEPGGAERSIWTIVGRASALIGLIAAALGLLYQLWPNLQRRADPPTRRAAFTELAVEPGITFRQYLQRVDQEPGDLSEATLARRGAFLEFNVDAQGWRGKALALKLELVNAATGDEVGQEQSTKITPEKDGDPIAWQAFLVYPPGVAGPFVARMELFDPDGVRIARKRSEPIRGVA